MAEANKRVMLDKDDKETKWAWRYLCQRLRADVAEFA